eukprot:jgi/Mesvir1/11800/Mv00160-RA.1
MSLPSNSFRRAFSLLSSASTPTELRIFLMSAALGAELPPKPASSAHPAPPTDASYKTPTAGGWSGRRRTDATATGPNHEDPGNRISGVNNEVEKNNEAEHKEASADCAPRSSRGMSHDLHPVVEFKKDGSSQEDASIIHVVGFDFDSTPYASLSPEEGAGYGSWGTGGSKRVTRRSISMSPLVSANRYFQEVDAEQLEEETPVRGNAAAASGDSPSPGPGLTRQGEACNARQPGDTGVEASQGEGTSDQQQQQLQQGGGRGRRPRRSWRSPNVTAMYPTLTLEYDKYRETMANLLPAELQLSPVPLAEFCRNISISKLGSPVIYPGLLD